MPIVYEKHYSGTGYTRQGGDIASTISKFTGNIKFPFQRYPGALHLFGHDFTGPGTNLHERLNPDGTPKPSSQPVDRVDLAAYHHDLSYAEHSDTPNRNIADEVMVRELDSIENPTLRERAERAVVKPIIAAKAKVDLGVEINTKPYNGFVNFQAVASKMNPP